jgi:hypothetical protein
MISFGKYQKMPSVLVLPSLNIEQQGLFGESRSFEIDQKFINTTGTTYRHVGQNRIYQQCLLCKTTCCITLSTDWDGAGRQFSKTKNFVLPADSPVYLITEDHPIYSRGPWTRFNVVVGE